jgi:hypothetical protein
MVFRRHKTKRGIVIIDTCFAEAFSNLAEADERVRARGERVATDAPEVREGMYLVWSCAAHAEAHESHAHGLFTRLLL